MRFQWHQDSGHLNGAFVFISASVPDLDRDPCYLGGPLDNLSMLRLIDRRVDDAVKSLVAQVLMAGGRVVHGGHPKVMPFIADQACNWKPATDGTSPVVTYQSLIFESKAPLPGRREMECARVASTRWVDIDPDEVVKQWRTEKFPMSDRLEEWLPMQAPEDRQMLRAPLLAMRIAMLAECAPIACVCIGGMEGIEAEARLFLDFANHGRIQAAPHVHVLRTTFGAAARFEGEEFLVEDQTNIDSNADGLNELENHPDYDEIMTKLVRTLRI